MARVTLQQHSASRSGAVRHLEAQISRDPNASLSLQFALQGDLERVRIPRQRNPVEASGLWRTTCFEAFVAEAGAEAYCEINLSPSREWAFYRFAAYRQPLLGTPPLAPQASPVISTEQTQGALHLSATIQLSRVLDVQADWQLALTAVIEEIDGTLSYWSMRHAPGKPDFHRRDTFAIELAA